MVKTYACKKATKNSRVVIAVTVNQGITAKILMGFAVFKNDQLKLAKIFSKAWPDIIFANKRVLKLNTRAMYEMNSIKTKNGAPIVGIPDGRKKLTVSQRVCVTAIKLIPIKWPKAKKNVIINELVGVNE